MGHRDNKELEQQQQLQQQQKQQIDEIWGQITNTSHPKHHSHLKTMLLCPLNEVIVLRLPYSVPSQSFLGVM